MILSIFSFERISPTHTCNTSSLLKISKIHRFMNSFDKRLSSLDFLGTQLIILFYGKHWHFTTFSANVNKHFVFACVLPFHRTLHSEIEKIHQLRASQSHAPERSTSTDDPAETSFLRQEQARLQAREEVLEEHNHQLQFQLSRLRALLQQVLLEVEFRRGEQWVWGICLHPFQDCDISTCIRHLQARWVIDGSASLWGIQHVVHTAHKWLDSCTNLWFHSLAINNPHACLTPELFWTI